MQGSPISVHWPTLHIEKGMLGASFACLSSVFIPLLIPSSQVLGNKSSLLLVETGNKQSKLV